MEESAYYRLMWQRFWQIVNSKHNEIKTKSASVKWRHCYKISYKWNRWMVNFGTISNKTEYIIQPLSYTTRR